MGRGIRTGRPNIDNSPPGGWSHWGAERHVADMNEQKYERNLKIEGQYQLVRITKDGPSQTIKGPFSFADAERNKDKLQVEELQLPGSFMGKWEVERID